jgi:hypothetical protein
MARKTVVVSDLSGEEIEDGKVIDAAFRETTSGVGVPKVTAGKLSGAMSTDAVCDNKIVR